MTAPTAALVTNSVSIWLDALSRKRITSQNLANPISTRNISGVTTTNPTIFARALGDDGGVAGRVSLEVSPDLAHDTDATISHTHALWARGGRLDVLIKIPATKAGLPAITGVLESGVSFKVTPIFSLERYSEVMDAYLSGIEQTQAAGHDPSSSHPAASFFVSRVDTEVDKRLAAVDAIEAFELALAEAAELAGRPAATRPGRPWRRRERRPGAHDRDRQRWAVPLVPVRGGHRDLATHAEHHRVECNTVRARENLSWNRPVEARLGYADPTAPTFPSPRACHPLNAGHDAQRSRRHRRQKG